jgi:hypothetical protein
VRIASLSVSYATIIYRKSKLLQSVLTSLRNVVEMAAEERFRTMRIIMNGVFVGFWKELAVGLWSNYLYVMYSYDGCTGTKYQGEMISSRIPDGIVSQCCPFLSRSSSPRLDMVLCAMVQSCSDKHEGPSIIISSRLTRNLNQVASAGVV